MSAEKIEETNCRQEFLFSLDSLRSADIHEFNFAVFVSDEAETRDPRDFLPQEEGLYVESELYNKWVKDASVPNRIGFEFEDALAIGRENSRNEVFFGTAVVSRHDNSEDERIKVAVKPYEPDQFDGDRYLADELTMMQKAKNIGLKVPDVFAVLKQDDQMYMVSRFKPEIITQDSIDWKNLSEEMTNSTLQRGVSSLAELHAHGLFHGDASPRNITIQPELNSIWHVDLERGRDTEDPIDTIINIKKDLYDYYTGVCGLRVIEATYAGMVNEVLEPYQRTMITKLGRSDEEEPRNLRTIIQLFEVLYYDLEKTFNGDPLKMVDRRELIASKGLGSISCTTSFAFS